MSWPSKVTEPEVTGSRFGRSPMMVEAAIDLPEPDSPTMHRTLARGESERHLGNGFGAVTAGRQCDGQVLDREDRHGHSPPPVVQAGVERIVQALADEVQRQDGEEQGDAWKDAGPPGPAGWWSGRTRS